MIVGTAVCPHPPLLLRALTGGQDPAAQVRQASQEALAVLAELEPEVLVVVGGADTVGTHQGTTVPERTFGGVGPHVGRSEALPLSLGIAQRLLEEGRHRVPVQMWSVAWGAGSDQITSVAEELVGRPERVGLLVMGDGSARRGPKAPGHLDERAFAFDESVRRALAEGDAEALLGLDADLADELMVAGRAAWQVMAEAVRLQGVPVRAEVLYADDPFGVMYLVGTWTCVS